MGSLAKPSVVAKCTVSDGYGSSPHSETVGCSVESSVEVECTVPDDSGELRLWVTQVNSLANLNYSMGWSMDVHFRLLFDPLFMLFNFLVKIFTSSFWIWWFLYLVAYTSFELGPY
nr:hypothetical protein CFP56_29723 [Quercus suber]